MAALLTGKSAAITGGVTGIGRAIALEYLRQGADVAVNHLGDPTSQQHFESMQKEAEECQTRLIDVAGDISKPETGTELVRRCVEEFGKLDIFVSNAGICQFAEFLS